MPPIPNPTEPVTLTAPVSTRSYTLQNREELRRVLETMDRSTGLTVVDRPEAVCLNPQARTIHGDLRYSAVALRQVCSLTVTGLGPLLHDLAGTRRRSVEAPGIHSVDDAVATFNLIIRRRFPLLDGMQMVYNVDEGLIEGFVGGRYKRLPNIDLFESVEEAMRDVPGGADLLSANLYGRLLLLRYVRSSALFDAADSPDSSDEYRLGYYYINTEVGDGSVRAYPTLVREADWSVCPIRTAAGGAVKHQGKDFHKRIAKLYASVTSWSPETDYYTRRVATMREASLGFTTDENPVARKRAIALRLRSKDFTLGLAGRCVQFALTQGADAGPAADAREARFRRNLYDLFCSMNAVSSSLPIILWERLGHAAYDVLTNRFNPLPRNASA